MNDSYDMLKLECLPGNESKILALLELDSVKANVAANGNEALKWVCHQNMPEVALKLS